MLARCVVCGVWCVVCGVWFVYIQVYRSEGEVSSYMEGMAA